MPSASRKRDRGESDAKGAAAPSAVGTSSRRSRGTPAQKKLNISQYDQDIGSEAVRNPETASQDDAAAPAAPLAVGSSSTNVANEKKGPMKEDAKKVSIKSEAGNDHSEEKSKTMSSQNTPIAKPQTPPETVSTSQPGNAGVLTAMQQPLTGDSKGQKGNKNIDESRDTRIKSMLQHRQILLDRMKRCRTAAEKRLDKLQPDQGKTNGETIKLDKKPLALIVAKPDDEEVKAFKELSRKAINAAKKQRQDTGDAERRPPVSLRRGSSVGKRMSAALSTLAPHSVGSSAAGVQDTQTVPLHHTQTTPKASGSAPPEAIPSINLPTPALSTVPQPVPAAAPIKQTTKSTGSFKQQSSQVKNSAAAAAITASSIQPSGGGRSGTGQKIKRMSSQKNLKSLPTSAHRSSMSVPDSYMTSAHPLHIGAGGGVLPPNRLAHPAVVYPEAMTLREKRNSIRSKLATMLYERQKRIEGAERKRSIQQQSGAYLSKAPVSFASIIAQQSTSAQTTKLPQRRKTQWDYLLQEMKWLSTDFIEERKWKVSCGRTLSSSVQSSGLCLASLRSTKERGKRQATTVDVRKTDDMVFEEETANSVERVADTPKVIDKDRTPRFDAPSLTDLDSSRTAAKIISNMMAEFWDATSESGALSESDSLQKSAFQRHVDIRKKFEAESKSTRSIHDGINGNAPDSDQDKTKNPSESKSDETLLPRKVPEEMSYSRILKQIEEKINKIEDFTSDDEELDIDISHCDDFKLSTYQNNAVNFVEKIWSDCLPFGGILDGPPGYGKTLSACCLLSQHESEGPQLVLCNPSHAIRWKHELNRFEGLHPVVYGLQCGISNPSSPNDTGTHYGPGDIIIAEYSALTDENAGEDALPDVSRFHTIILDSRYPSQIQSIQNATTSSPEELMSDTWWKKILSSLSFVHSKRLIIEDKDDSSSDRQLFPCNSSDERSFLDLLTSKVSFVLGPSLFHSSKKSVSRKVLSWAKRRVKAGAETEGSQTQGEKLESIQNLLHDILNHFCCSSFNKSIERNSKPVKGNVEWNVKQCNLPDKQLSHYQKCCADVRGALSLGGYSEKPSDSTLKEACKISGQALLRLRKILLHPDLSSLLYREKCLISNKKRVGHDKVELGQNVYGRHMPESSSQPDIDLAVEILSASAKMRELVSILYHDCGYKIKEDAAILDIIGEAQRANKSTSRRRGRSKNGEDLDRKKKVVILASLPEAQLLTSMVLKSLGISHEIFLKSSENSASRYNRGVEQSSSTRNDTEGTLAWIECQLALSRFNSTAEGTTFTHRTVDLIITSPVTVGSPNGGLGVSTAEVVVSIDEDWSGRCELITNSILSSSGLNGGKDSCQFLRLICASTCEEYFLSTSSLTTSRRAKSKSKEAPSRKHPWPVDAYGYLQMPSSEVSFDVHKLHYSAGMFCFPCANILKVRNKELSEIMKQTLPPDFASGSQARFLPDLKEDSNFGSVLLESLICIESLSCPLTGKYLPEQHEKASALWLKEPTTLRQCLASIVPPLPNQFVQKVATRRDVGVLPSRYYVEVAAKSVDTTIVQAQALRKQLKDPLQQATQDDQECLADAWHKSGMSCKPDDMAISLLLYNQSSDDDEKLGSQNLMSSTSKDNFNKKKNRSSTTSVSVTSSAEHSKQQSDDVSANIKKDGSVDSRRLRCNGFSTSYSTARGVRPGLIRDGNQGCEPIVYFPPLFPNMLFSVDRAKYDIINFTTARNQGVVPQVLGLEEKKRKEPDALAIRIPETGKRPRINPAPTKVLSQPSTSAVVPPILPSQLPVQTMVPKAGPGASNMVKPIPTAKAAPSIISEDEASWADATTLIDIDEDFGLIGVGALSNVSDAAMIAANSTVNATSYLQWNDQYEPNAAVDCLFANSLACDSEEADSSTRPGICNTSLDSMILFVKKSRGSATLAGNHYYPGNPNLAIGAATSSSLWVTPPLPSLPPPNPAITSVPAFTPAPAVCIPSDTKMNGTTGSKKTKKKSASASLAGPSSLSRTQPGFSATGQPMNQLASLKFVQSTASLDVYRHKVLLLLRQGGPSASVYDFLPFRLAFSRMHNRMTDRVGKAFIKTSAASGSGPGIPLLLSKEFAGSNRSIPKNRKRSLEWTAFVKKLSGDRATIGDEANLLANSQRSALRRSLVSPCRVDFGPFEAGYLSLTQGMTGISPPRSRVGVTLPMGVKIPQQKKEEKQAPWSAAEDKKLQNCTVRFGLNWHLASRAVTGVQDIGMYQNPNDSNSSVSHHRSARQCRERWQALAKANPSLANDVRNSERGLREHAVWKPKQIAISLGLREYAASSEGTAPVDTGLREKLLTPMNIDPKLEIDRPNDAEKKSGGVTPMDVDPKSKGANPMDVVSKEKDNSPTPVDFSSTKTPEPKLPMPMKESCSTKTSEPELVSVPSNKGTASVLLPPELLAVGKGSSHSDASAGTPETRKVSNAGKSSKKSFSFFKQAALKKQGTPITIPGYSGSGKPTLVPSHTSHEQSVKDAIASTSNTRSDFWPLQLLDLADRKRGMTKSHGAPPASSASSIRQQQAVSVATRAPPAQQTPAVRAQQQRAVPQYQQQMQQQQPPPQPSQHMPPSMSSPARSPHRQQAIAPSTQQAFTPQPSSVAPQPQSGAQQQTTMNPSTIVDAHAASLAASMGRTQQPQK